MRLINLVLRLDKRNERLELYSATQWNIRNIVRMLFNGQDRTSIIRIIIKSSTDFRHNNIVSG